MDGLEDIERMECNPEILLALSPLYMYEIPTSQVFLLKKLGYDRGEINKLVKMGEIIKQNIKGKTYYGLPHSSLALAYWEYGNNYRECLLFPEYNEYIYNYVTSDVPNGLDIVVHNRADVITFVLNRLALENKTLRIIEKEENKHAYASLSDILADTYCSDFEWPYKLDKYYSSEDFLKYLAEQLLKNHFFLELSSLTHKYQLFLKKHISQINVKELLNEIYISDYYAYGCEYLYRIGSIDKQVMSEIRKTLDPSKLADVAIRNNYLGNIWIALKYLFFIDEDFGLRFWKSMDKNTIVNTFSEHDFSRRCLLLNNISFTSKEIKLDIVKGGVKSRRVYRRRETAALPRNFCENGRFFAVA